MTNAGIRDAALGQLPRQAVSALRSAAEVPAALGGRTATVWADERSVHVFIDSELVRTHTSQFTAADLNAPVQPGGRIAGPEPATAALPDGPKFVLVVEVDRLVGRDGDVGLGLGRQRVKLAAQLAGQQVVLRFDGQLMHVIGNGRVVKPLPPPIPSEQRAQMSRSAGTPHVRSSTTSPAR